MRCLAILLTLLLVSCDDSTYPGDAGVDTDAPVDVAPDTSPDAVPDGDPDAPPTTSGFVAIPPGEFTMGSPTSEPGRMENEAEHVVTLTRGFEIMETEVTAGQFEALMGYDPSSFTGCGSGCPVETVSWHEAAAYANAMSTDGGLAECYTCTGSGASVTCTSSTTYSTPYDCPGYRLPTEAEWEYAARAGTTEATYNGTSTLLDCTAPNTVLDPIAWFCGNSSVIYSGCHDCSGAGGPRCCGPNPAGDKTPNDWDLYDMLGNVREWCNDWYGDYGGDITDPWGSGTESIRVVRGGSWVLGADMARAAKRQADPADHRSHDVGFRLARTLP